MRERSPVAASWTSTPSQAGPANHSFCKQCPLCAINSSDQDKDKRKRMDFMRVFRAEAKESPPLPSSPSLSSTKGRLEISNTQPHSNPSYRPEISTVAAHKTRSPDLSSSSSDMQRSFFSKRQASPKTAAEMMQRMFSSSRLSSNTLSAETNEKRERGKGNTL